MALADFPREGVRRFGELRIFGLPILAFTSLLMLAKSPRLSSHSPCCSSDQSFGDTTPCRMTGVTLHSHVRYKEIYAQVLLPRLHRQLLRQHVLQRVEGCRV